MRRLFSDEQVARLYCIDFQNDGEFAGGCVAGAGTLRPVKESTASVERFKNAASSMSTTESPYLDRLKDVEEKC